MFAWTYCGQVRARVRLGYSIPPSCCGPCDDFCCSFFMMPFTACQVCMHATAYTMHDHHA